MSNHTPRTCTNGRHLQIIRRRNAGLLAASLAALMAVSACGDPNLGHDFGELPRTGEQQQRGQAREIALGLDRVAHQDGSWSIRLPDALQTPTLRVQDGVTWRYQGQARYPARPEPLQPTWVYDAPDPESRARGQAHRLVGSVSVDAHGRKWIATAVDQARARQMIAAYDRQVQQTVGLESAAATAQEPAQPADHEGRWVLFTPLSWTRTDCNGGDDDIFRWDADDRNTVANPMNDRQKKVLLLTGPRGTCSGTMVDDEWLLTAAHCVTTSTGTPYANTAFDACTRGNYQAGALCFSSIDVTVAPGYTGDGDFSDDYAVVRLSGQPGVGWMAISQASNSTIKNATGYNVGYPGFAPGCVTNTASAINAGFPALKAYKNNGDVIGLTANRIKTRLDLATGHSGGPFFYYPGGCCGSHYLTGVVAGHVNVAIGKDYNGGPKGRAIRSWVITNTP